MSNGKKRSGLLLGNKQIGPFPDHRLKHVDQPTTLITGNISRIDVRENALARAARGDYGLAAQREARRIAVKYPLSAAQFDTALHIGAIKDNLAADSKAPITGNPLILSRHIKRLGYFLKADIVGICRLPEYAVYSHDMLGKPIDIDYQFAIVIVMRKEYETAKASTGSDWIGDSISFQAYQHLALVSQTMANYIRRLGYPASAQHPPARAGRYQVLLPPLLLWAGIGELSRSGIILSPFLGLSYKAAAILTNLPLVPDKPIDFGLQDYCRHCLRCAELCPSKSIPKGDKVIYNGYETWKLDERRCTSFHIMNANGTFCNTCVKVCPWTRPTTWPHNSVRWLVSHSGLARRFSIKIEKILGHEKAGEQEKWWFDLEDVDGVLKIPPHSRDSLGLGAKK